MKFDEVFQAFNQFKNGFTTKSTEVTKARIAVWHRVRRDAHDEEGKCDCGRVIASREELGGLTEGNFYLFAAEVVSCLAKGAQPRVFRKPPSRFCVPCHPISMECGSN